jgi:hypothetical protein
MFTRRSQRPTVDVISWDVAVGNFQVDKLGTDMGCLWAA